MTTSVIVSCLIPFNKAVNKYPHSSRILYQVIHKDIVICYPDL